MASRGMYMMLGAMQGLQDAQDRMRNLKEAESKMQQEKEVNDITMKQKGLELDKLEKMGALTDDEIAYRRDQLKTYRKIAENVQALKEKEKNEAMKTVTQQTQEFRSLFETLRAIDPNASVSGEIGGSKVTLGKAKQEFDPYKVIEIANNLKMMDDGEEKADDYYINQAKTQLRGVNQQGYAQTGNNGKPKEWWEDNI